MLAVAPHSIIVLYDHKSYTVVAVAREAPDQYHLKLAKGQRTAGANWDWRGMLWWIRDTERVFDDSLLHTTPFAVRVGVGLKQNRWETRLWCLLWRQGKLLRKEAQQIESRVRADRCTVPAKWTRGRTQVCAHRQTCKQVRWGALKSKLRCRCLVVQEDRTSADDNAQKKIFSWFLDRKRSSTSRFPTVKMRSFY